MVGKRRASLLATLSGAVLFSGCFLHRGGGQLQVSSVQSDYAPVVSFNARVAVDDSVRVDINLLRLLYPGEVFPGMGAVTGAIEMQALLVVTNPAGNMEAAVASVDRNGTRKPWIERAASGSVALSRGLVMGVEQRVGPVRFVMPWPDGTDRDSSWLVFRITGPSVFMPARLADGSEMPAPVGMPPIRVFACALKNLNGKVDKPRRTLQAEFYSDAC